MGFYIVYGVGSNNINYIMLFRCFRDLERDIKHLEGVISKDYGPEEEFASLSGQCFEYTDQEYTYKMCAFDYCSQRPNSQGKQVLSYKTTVK